MKYLITESQFKLLSELERHWIDFEYEEEYNKLKNKIVPYIAKMIDSYDDSFGEIVLFDSNDKIAMVFKPHGEGNNGSLYYDRNFVSLFNSLFTNVWSRNGKYFMSDAFTHLFPQYNVVKAQSAHIS
jgi:hypothetical protein